MLVPYLEGFISFTRCFFRGLYCALIHLVIMSGLNLDNPGCISALNPLVKTGA